VSRRTTRAAEAAAAQASDAARTLAARSHEARSERVEPSPESSAEPKSETPKMDPSRIEKLRDARPHAQAMDDLIARRGLDKEDEPKEEPKSEEKPKEEPKAEEPKVEAPEEPKAEPQPEPVAEAPKVVKVKVDGEEFDVPQEEIDEAGGIKAYQKERAAQNRLEKARQALEETRKSQAQIAEWLMRQQQQAQPKKPQVSIEHQIAEKMDIVRFGTKEEAAKAWLEIQQLQQPKQLDPRTIVEQATNKIKHDQAVAEFDKEFQDVATNPLLLKLVVALRNERLAQAKGPIDWPVFYRTIGNEVRSVAGRQSQPASAPTKTPSTTSSVSDKEARKASITVLPTSSARAELPKEEKELTPEEERKAWIAEQKKARGQA